MHYYQFNIGDYARDTSHLSVIEHGIYRLLLDWCYLNEKPITTEKAMRVGRGYPEETQSVLSEFFVQVEDGWTHSRVLAEVEKFHKKAETNRKNGAKGGRPVSENNPVGSQSGCEVNLNQEPRTKNQEPKVEAPRKRSAAQPLKPEDLSQQVWNDWMTLRKAKRLPLTETAWADTIAESQKAGLTPSEAVTHAVRSNWAGFRAAWFLKDNPAPSGGGILAGAI